MNSNKQLTSALLVLVILHILYFLIGNNVLIYFIYMMMFSVSLGIFFMVLTTHKYIENKGFVWIGYSFLPLSGLLGLLLLNSANIITNSEDIFILYKIVELILFGIGVLFIKKELNIKRTLVIQGFLLIVLVFILGSFDFIDSFEANGLLMIGIIMVLSYISMFLYLLIKGKKDDLAIRYISITLLGFVIFSNMLLFEISHPYLVTLLLMIQFGSISVLGYGIFHIGFKEILYTNEKRIDESQDRIIELIRVDELTKLPNRRYLLESLDKSFRLAKREKHSISLMFIDIMEFRYYNAKFGNVKGDSILRRVGTMVQNKCLRPLDFVGRYGNDLFMVILPNTDKEGSYVIAERIIKGAKELRIEHHEIEQNYLDINIGFASCIPSKELTLDEFLNKAQATLHNVKEKKNSNYLGIDIKEEKNNERD